AMHLAGHGGAGGLEGVAERLHHLGMAAPLRQAPPLGGAPRGAEARARELALRRVAFEHLLQVGRVFRLGVGRVERRLVVVEEHLRRLPERSAGGKRARSHGDEIAAVHASSSKMRVMPEVIVFKSDGYRYTKGGFQFSSGVAAEPGFAIERARLGHPVPLAAGLG